MKTKIINFYGGPGTGKSTVAAHVFSGLKDEGVEAELITEYVKQWAWADKAPVKMDQFYIFGQQARREYSLFNKVEFAITDSPVLLSGYYTELHGTPKQKTLFRHMVQTYYDMSVDDNVEHIHIFLKRVKPFSSKGRFHSKAEAEKIDTHMKFYLESLGINFIEINGDKEEVFEYVKKHLLK